MQLQTMAEHDNNSNITANINILKKKETMQHSVSILQHVLMIIDPKQTTPNLVLKNTQILCADIKNIHISLFFLLTKRLISSVINHQEKEDLLF